MQSSFGFFFPIPLRVISIFDSVPQVLCENRKAMNSFDFCFSNACLFSQKITLAIYKKLHSLCHWPFVTSLLEKCLIICLNVFCNLLFICHLSFSYHIFLSHVKLEIIHIFIYVAWAFLSLILLSAFGVGRKELPMSYDLMQDVKCKKINSFSSSLFLP